MADLEMDVEFDLDTDIEFDIEPEIIPNAMDTFYEKEFWFSYSSLKLLLYNPAAFAEKYINKNYEERLDKHLIDGKLIHCLILQPDEFPEMFIISPLTVPTGKNREILHNTFKQHISINGTDINTLDDYNDFIISELERVNLHQALVDDKPKPNTVTLTGNQKRLAKMLTDENRSYFEYMIVRGSKNIIDQKQLDRCTKSAEIIRNNSEFCKYMGIGADPAFNQVVNEKMYYMPLKDRKYGLKGIIDNKNIDHANKIIYVNDFKTTGKELSEFPNAVQFFNYNIQAVIYMMLVTYHFGELIDKGYTVEFRFIAIDKNLQAYAFKVTQTSLNKWLLEFQDKLVIADYHYINKTYDLPYAFANNLVAL